jgi:hypothetical protein
MPKSNTLKRAGNELQSHSAFQNDQTIYNKLRLRIFCFLLILNALFWIPLITTVLAHGTMPAAFWGLAEFSVFILLLSIIEAIRNCVDNEVGEIIKLGLREYILSRRQKRELRRLSQDPEKMMQKIKEGTPFHLNGEGEIVIDNPDHSEKPTKHADSNLH